MTNECESEDQFGFNDYKLGFTEEIKLSVRCREFSYIADEYSGDLEIEDAHFNMALFDQILEQLDADTIKTLQKYLTKIVNEWDEEEK